MVPVPLIEALAHVFRLLRPDEVALKDLVRTNRNPSAMLNCFQSNSNRSGLWRFAMRFS